MSEQMTVDSVVARIESGALGEGYSVSVEDLSADGYERARLHVIRYGRQKRGYIAMSERDNEIDLSALKIAGMSEASVLAALTA